MSVEALVEQVLARNPSLAQMVAAWQAASARYPQARSLDDPMFGVTVAPGAFGSNEVEGGYRLDVSQKFPWPGKRQLRGENALAEARAAGNEVEDMRLQLVESARSAFYEYYLSARALEVNAESLRLLREFRKNAETRYVTAKLPTNQEVLQADVEIGRQQERQLSLERSREVAVARINTLLHLPPDTPLPAPPRRVGVEGSVPIAQELRAAALARRPDLRALANRIEAEQASLALAHKEFYPDVELTAGYDAFWQEKPLRGMVGVRVNLPIRTDRRRAAVAEAQARISQRSAELDRLADQVSFQVQEAHARVSEASRAVLLYEKTILPAARSNVETAVKAYTTGSIPFVSLLEAQRNVVNLQDRYHELVADYFRWLAALERAVGGPLAPWPPIDAPCQPRPVEGVPHGQRISPYTCHPPSGTK